MPGVFKASTVFFPNVATMREREWKNKTGYTYGLHGTPTTYLLEERLATLEGGAQCLLVPSGLAAIATVALALLRAGEVELVVGSKAMRGAHDRRPLGRRAATRIYNGLLRVTLGFTGTDTHGLKAFRRAALLPVVARCVVGHDVFASELVIRAERDGVRVREIPVELAEKRAPSVRLLRRVPKVLRNLGRLMAAIHLGVGEREAR